MQQVQVTNNRNLWVDYLRSAITVLVVAHHSSLAYTSFATFNKEAYIISSHPVVDPHRSQVMDIFENYNDIFFMFLMFFIGGLFLVRSLEKKGYRKFLQDRIFRLFIPFLFLGTALMLIAYFPAWMIAKGNASIIAYVKDFFTVEAWPVGPPWFIWVLFVFNLLFAISYAYTARAIKKLADRVAELRNQPLIFFLLIFFITSVLYIPVAFATGAGAWTGWGPFDFQLSRILTYAGYFLLGTITGAADFNNGIFLPNAAVTKNWKRWIFLSVLLYTAITLNTQYKWLEKMVLSEQMNENMAWLIYYTVYTGCCTAGCIAFLTGFRVNIQIERKWWTGLSENAYLIYLLHYVFVIWMQYWLMNWDQSALLKFAIVFTVSLSASWMAAFLLRKIPVVRKYL